ncbi:MAG: hypothetical protein U0T73_03760 [Chitinophagales bacterium]
MLRIFIFSAILMVSVLLHGQVKDEFSKKDNWINLIETSGMSSEKFKMICAHFPVYDQGFKNAAAYQLFVTARYNWFREYPGELQNFMTSKEIEKIHPAPGDLGLDEMLYREKTLNHPLWQRFKYAYISDAELATFAPHFPKPENIGDSLAEIRAYDRAAEDWKKLLPNEWAAFNNHPKLFRTSGLKAGQQYPRSVVSDKDLFRNLPISGTSLPNPSDYRSGNPELDKIRLEAYTKKWYFDRQPSDYYRIYEPDKLFQYQKDHPFTPHTGQ